MPAQRQTNTHPHTAHLPEARDEDGTVFAACEVEPGAAIEWPRRLTGFSGWTDPEPEPAEPAEPEPAPTAPARAGKSKSNTGATPADVPEVTS